MTTQLQQQMRYRDRDMIPRFLVIGMFTLMALALAIVSFAQLSGAANVGVLEEAPIVESRSVTLRPSTMNNYDLLDDTGAVIAASTDDKGGFYAVIGKVIDRRRIVHQVTGNPPVQVVRRENGNFAVLDPSTNFTIELIGYGKDNIAAFGRLLD
jgi:putative photosynthetic complex assembly protein